MGYEARIKKARRILRGTTAWSGAPADDRDRIRWHRAFTRAERFLRKMIYACR